MAGDSPQNFKKRVFSGTRASSFSSSSSSMEPELVESVPPTVCTSKAPLEKEVILHEVIDIDKDYDSTDIMVADEKFNTMNKEKVIKDVSDGSGNHEAKDASPGSDTLINPDDILFYDDEDIYLNTDDIMDVDQHSSLQAYFDRLKTPPGVEASVPWFPDHYLINKKPATTSTSSYTNSQMQWDAVGLIDKLDQYASSSSSKHPQFNVKPTSASSSSLPTQLNASSQAPEVKLSSPWPLPQASQSGNKSFTPQHRGSVLICPFGIESSMNHPLGVPPPSGGHFHRGSVVNTSFGVESSANHSLGVLPPSWGHVQDGGKNTSYSLNSNIPAQAGSVNHPPGFEPPMSWGQVQSNHKMKPFFNPAHVKSSYSPVSKAAYIPSKEEADIFWANATGGQTSIAATGGSKSPFELISSSEMKGIGNDIMRKFELFKQFDTVQDYSDHHYTCNGSSMGQPSKNWAKRIQEEWKILEMDLPDTIFVRVYEERMEFLRAVIVGAVGTPYHDGLFFFDFFFPCDYPNEPPHVYYHSGGLRLNPNLYGNGKVCLSLLNTWHGDKNEMWIPGKSTMLQVLVSIQGLILNQEPFFNEPGMAYMSGSQNGEIMSRQYNEDTFILSLRTMSYTMRRPPKHFEDFVRGHFCKRAHGILMACKGYMNGAQIGCLVEGGVQNVEVGDKSCSQNFRKTLAGYVDMLVVDFTNMGAEHCEKFVSPEKKGNKPEPVIPSG